MSQAAMNHASLVQLDRARTAIIQAKSLQEVKEIRDQAEALRVYARQAKDSLEIQNYCAEIKLRAERRAGEMLAENVEHKGGRPKKPSHDVRVLKDAGISWNESSRWQRVASVPEAKFEEHVAETKDAKKELTTNGVLKLATRLKPRNAVKAEPSEGFVTKLSDLSGQKFGCIYVDPPWQYHNQSTRASTDNHYATMTLADLCAMPIGELAAENSHLHLWTTNGFLFDCPQLLAAWGFTFKSSFVWVKPQMGIGNYWRCAHEFLLLAVRGKATAAAKGLKSWAEIERRGHSEKPDEVRAMVERLSPGPYLELFGRKAVKGWTVFGNETLK